MPTAEKKKTRKDYAALIPTLTPSKTYSAVQILRRLQVIIRKEPKRLNMNWWMDMFAGQPFDGVSQATDDKDLPACGTVGCAAGWINTITGHYRQNSRWAAESAIQNLGLGRRKFIKSAWGFESCDIHYKDDDMADAGFALTRLFQRTHLDAKGVVNALDNLIHQHKPALRRAKVTIKE